MNWLVVSIRHRTSKKEHTHRKENQQRIFRLQNAPSTSMLLLCLEVATPTGLGWKTGIQQ
jgi:hypothetical protein